MNELIRIQQFITTILTQHPLEQRFLEGVTQQHRDLELRLKYLLTSAPDQIWETLPHRRVTG